MRELLGSGFGVLMSRMVLAFIGTILTTDAKALSVDWLAAGYVVCCMMPQLETKIAAGTSTNFPRSVKLRRFGPTMAKEDNKSINDEFFSVLFAATAI